MHPSVELRTFVGSYTHCYVTYCHKVPIRGLLAVETKNYFALWLEKFKQFVNSEYRKVSVKYHLAKCLWQSVCEVSVRCRCNTNYIGRYKYISVTISTEYQLRHWLLVS